MRYLTVEEVLALHSRLIATSGGTQGVRDQNALDSAVAQPQMTFDGVDLYTTIARKAAALGHSLISNHPFIDGNKRVGHAAMEVMLLLNGHEIVASVDRGVIINVASGTMSRDELLLGSGSASWSVLTPHITLRATEPREFVSFDAVLFPSATESTRGPVTPTFDRCLVRGDIREVRAHRYILFLRARYVSGQVRRLRG
jgi:death-on-curing protein